MHVAGGFLVSPGDFCGERLDERDRQIAGPCGGLGQISEIEGAGLAGLRDRLGTRRRDDADGGLRARQRRLEIEHVLQVGQVVANRAHGGA